jgi:hypothetical protein
MGVRILDRTVSVLAVVILALAFVVAVTLLGMLATWTFLGSATSFFGYVPIIVAATGGGAGFWALCKVLNHLAYGKWI